MLSASPRTLVKGVACRVMPLLPVYVQTFHFKYIYIPFFFFTYSSTSPGCLHRQVPYCVSNRLFNFIIIQPRMSYHTEQDDVDLAGLDLVDILKQDLDVYLAELDLDLLLA